MSKYTISEVIGEGSFGKVFRGKCKETGEVVALKFIPKHLKADHELTSLRRECEIQRGLSHPNIVLMLDSFETDREIVAVSEYVPQQLCALLMVNGSMGESRVCSIACNLLSALYYLHSHRIVHRDIKPQNILLTITGVAKLCDFGFSKKMEINTYVLESIKGTPLYMAPELIEQQPYDHKADLWSLGCILFELLTSKPPFSTNSIVHLIEMVRSKPIQWPVGISPLCKTFLEGLLQKDQERRFEWSQMLQHPWVCGGITLVPHNPRISSLTSPLTHSQQQVKEHQKQQLVMRNMGQPNLLPRAIARKILNDARAVPNYEPALPPPSVIPSNPSVIPTDNDDTVNPHNKGVHENICSSLEKMSLSNGTNTNNKNSDSICKLERNVLSNALSNISKSTSHTISVGKVQVDMEHTERELPVLKSELIAPFSSQSAGNQMDEKAQASLSDALCAENAAVDNAQSTDNRLSSTTHTDDAPIERLEPQSTSKEVEIQEDEWCHFLNQAIADVMERNFDVYAQTGELAMYVSPLRNSTCPVSVVEKISVLFMLPFVLKPEEDTMNDIVDNYLQQKIPCNLLYACKNIQKESRGKIADAPPDFSKEQITTLNSALNVICHLVHLDASTGSLFLKQFCEGVCVLECYEVLGCSLLHAASSSQLLANILAILSQILRIETDSSGPDSKDMVLQVIVAALNDTNDHEATEEVVLKEALRFLLMSLLTHTTHLVSILLFI